MSATHAAGSTTPDADLAISEHLARVGYDDLPAAVIAAVKSSIVDTLACVLAGTPGEEVVPINSLVQAWAGTPTSTVFGAGGLKVPPDNAVLANAATVHQYDFDDTHDKGVCHPTSASLPAALAVAQERGGVSGRELIAAVALANDLTSRIALAIGGKLNAYPWIRATIAGIFGATAASAKILGATAAQHRHALGLALPQAAVTLASLHHGGSSVRSIRDGLAYRNGVLAAELAMRGLRGDPAVFDGPYGLYHAYFRGEYDRRELVDELGTRYESARISLKPWPSCRHLHGTLTAVIELMETHNLAFEDIDHVVLHVGDINLDRCRPVSVGMVPTHRIDLLCNLLFAVGAALRHRDLPLALYREARLADDIVLNAVPKIKWVHDPVQNGPWTLEPGMVDIHTVNGKVHTRVARLALGHPDYPMSAERLKKKFIAGASGAVRPLTEARATEIFDTVMNLDQVADVEALARLLE